MYIKLSSFHQLMQYAFYLQYFSFSVPIFTIRNKTLVINEISSWIELTILFSVATGQVYTIVGTPSGVPLDSILQMLSVGVNITTVIFILIEGWEVKTKSKLMKSIFEKIKILDKSITLENKLINHLTIQLAIWSVPIILTASTTLLTLILYDTTITLKIFGIIATLRTYVVPATNMVQFFTLITLVRYYLEWIDKQLNKIRQLHLDGKEECKPYMTFRPHFRDSEECKIANKIENIRKIYGCIHDLKRDINQAYNMRLWMDVVGTGLKVLYFIYFNLILIQNSKEKFYFGSNITQYFLHYWIIFLMVKFLESVRLCGKVKACGKNLGVRVHEIFSSSYCESVKNELTTFSLELLHRDPNIKANNIFEIDYPLTASVVRGIVMQLIALMQINVPNNKSANIPHLFASEATNITLEIENNTIAHASVVTI